MKTIVLARHAKSDWSMGLPDIERPLNNRGLEDAPRMGRLLKAYEFTPDLIVSSPANRAHTTAKLVADEIDYTDKIQIEKNIYASSYGQVYSIIQDLPDDKDTVMLFGHNPTTEDLIKFLLQMRASIVVPTCGMACIDFRIGSWTDVNPMMGQLRWFLIPKLVKRFKN